MRALSRIVCYVAPMHSASESEFARVLAGIEKRTGLSHQRVADAAGVDRSQVWRWVRSGSSPGYEPVRRLAAWLIREHPEVADDAALLLAAAGYETPPSTAIPVAVNTAREFGINPDDPRDPWKRSVEELVEAARDLHGSSPTGAQIFFGTPEASYEAGLWDDQRFNESTKILLIAIQRAARARDATGQHNNGRSGRAGLALVVTSGGP